MDQNLWSQVLIFAFTLNVDWFQPFTRTHKIIIMHLSRVISDTSIIQYCTWFDMYITLFFIGS